MLTLIASIDFGFADERRTVNLVTPQEDIGWVSISSTNIASHGLSSATIVAFLTGTTVSK